MVFPVLQRVVAVVWRGAKALWKMKEIEENEYENERNIFEILQTIDWETQSWEKYARQILVFVWNSAVREMFNFYFSAFFC